MITRQTGTGEKGFYAPMLTAITRRAGSLLITRPRQRIVPPLSGDAVGTVYGTTMHHHATTGTGAEYYTEHHRCAGRGTVQRLRQGEAIGIIGNANRTI